MKAKVTMTRTVIQEISVTVDIPDTRDWIEVANREALNEAWTYGDWKVVAINRPEIRRTSKRNAE